MNNLKTFFKELFEADNFTARSKDSGKLVNFKSKASYDSALKAGSHEAPDDSKGDKGDSKSTPKKVAPKVNIFDKPEPAGDGMDTVKSIASKTGLRTTAVAGWADENGVNLAKVSAAIISKKLKPMDFMTAVSGKPGNKYAKDIVAKYSTKPEPVDKGGPKTLGMKKKSFFGNDTEDGPDPQSTQGPSKPDRFGDKFELGTPAVYTDNGKEYSGEVVMNPSTQRVQIDGKFVTIGKGSTKGIQVYGSDTFIVPDDWNDAKGFNDATEKPKSTEPRKGNPQVNKATKKAAESAGITPQKLGNEEYKKTMYKSAIEALTDSNYHDEARALVAKLEGKPEFAKKPEYPSMDDPDYIEKMNALKTTGVDSSEYWDIDDTTRKFAIGVSQESSYDGATAVDGIAFTLKMNGFHKEAEMIQSVLKEAKSTRLTSLLKEVTESEIINQLRDIVKNKQSEVLKDPNSGKKIRVDMQSANTTLKIYDGLSASNKATMVKMGLPKMMDTAFKIASKYNY